MHSSSSITCVCMCVCVHACVCVYLRVDSDPDGAFPKGRKTEVGHLLGLTFAPLLYHLHPPRNGGVEPTIADDRSGGWCKVLFVGRGGGGVLTMINSLKKAFWRSADRPSACSSVASSSSLEPAAQHNTAYIKGVTWTRMKVCAWLLCVGVAKRVADKVRVG